MSYNVTQISVLQNADYTWRAHHIFLIRASFEVDAARLLSQPLLYTQDMAMHGRSLIQELENLLLNEDLLFHPVVHQRNDILSLARQIYDHHPGHIALRYQLSEYFDYGDIDTKLSMLRILIRLYPEVYRYQIEFLQHAKGMLWPWLYNKILLSPPCFHSHSWYYTPAIGMAIGHYRDLLDIVFYSDWVQRNYKPIKNFKLYLVIIRSKFVETAVLDWLAYKYPFVQIIEYSTLLYSSPAESLRMLDWSPSMQYIPKRERQAYCASIPAKSEPSSGSVLLNLRTSEYKGNDQHPIMHTRSVMPSTYDLLTQQISLAGLRIHLLSGSSVTQIPAHALVHVAHDYHTQVTQLQHLIDSDYLVGTLTGLTNLAPIAGYRVVYTNMVMLPYERCLGREHIVSTKNLSFLPSLKYVPILERALMFIQPWAEGANPLIHHAIIEDSSPQQLVQAHNEFLALRCNSHPYGNTLHSILASFSLDTLMHSTQNINLCSDTASLFRQLLSY